MPMLNDCNFIGRVGKQPQLQKSKEGKPFLRFTLYVDQGKDHTGKERELLLLPIVCFGKLAEVIAERLTQGVQVFVKGRLQLSSYTDPNGIERQGIAINANDIQVFSSSVKSQPVEQEGEREITAQEG